jgi:hypothetical protein
VSAPCGNCHAESHNHAPDEIRPVTYVVKQAKESADRALFFFAIFLFYFRAREKSPGHFYS